MDGIKIMEFKDYLKMVKYASWEKPEIACAISFENQGHGGSVAAPFAKEIVEFWDSMEQIEGE